MWTDGTGGRAWCSPATPRSARSRRSAGAGAETGHHRATCSTSPPPATRPSSTNCDEGRLRRTHGDQGILCRTRGNQTRARSGRLLDADQVASRVADGAVANSVRLLRRLLDDLGVVGLQPLEDAVEVLGGQDDDGLGALGHHLDDGAALVVGDAGVDRRWVQHDGRAGLAWRADRDPAQATVSDILANL